MNITQGMEDFSRTHISVIGAEDNFGANAMDQSKLPREAVIWMGVAHGDRRAIDIWDGLLSFGGFLFPRNKYD